MADLLATTTDLAGLLQINPADLNATTATLLLETATAQVQAVCGQRIVQVANDTIVLDLNDYDGGQYLPLPEAPVTAVGAVLVGATTITDHTVQLRYNRLWRSTGWRSVVLPTPQAPSTVTVTYTHGWVAGHQRLQLARAATLFLAAAAYNNPAGATRMSIDDYQEAHEPGAQAALPEAVACQLRRQYGRSARSVRLAAC